MDSLMFGCNSSWIVVTVHVRDCDLVQHSLYCTNF